MTQRPLRLLTVAPVPAPAADLAVALVPLDGGGFLATGEVTPELRRLAYDMRPREPDPTTADTAEKRAASLRATLLAFAERPGPPALVMAGRLLRDYGEGARRVLWRTWTPGWGVTRARLDSLLETAGVPAGDGLL